MTVSGAPERPRLVPLVGVDEVRRRLAMLFPAEFPDRGIVTGKMAARVVFVFLYGCFVEGGAGYLRPSAIYFFTSDQAQRTSDAEREAWLRDAFRPRFRPVGKRWYADTSREPIRDDLIRNRLVRMGIVTRRDGVATTSSAPVYQLSQAFARLFDPALNGAALAGEVEAWRARWLAPSALHRMALRAQGALAREGEVRIEMPDGSRIRASGGASSVILKALIEQYAPRWMKHPVVLWISASDRKTQPELVERAASVGLRFDARELLPDLILADLDEPLRVVFCEIVATDGPVDAERMSSLLAITRRSGIDDRNVGFVTAFLDRDTAALRKTFARIAAGGDVWFASEPELLVRLTVAPR